MTYKFLADQSLEGFLESLHRFGNVHGPTLNRLGVLSFNPILSYPELHLEYQRTLLPPKKYLLAPQTTTLQFSADSGYSLPAPDSEPIVLFGIHACDLASIAYLDRVFLSDRPDPIYKSRRDRLVLVGLSCEPDEFCFCGELATDSSPIPYDLFLSKTDGGYIVHHSSQLGAEIVSGIPGLQETKCNPRERGISESANRIIEAVEQGEKFTGSSLWDDFARRCLSCGACSLCCPTCYCLDVREYGALDGNTAVRIQEWDNCLFKSHGEVAGGTNFRKTRQERFHYRFLHKYYGFGPLAGTISCVGCGRCREVCPVKIDLLELFQGE